LASSRGMPNHTQPNITGSIRQYCQVTQCQDQWSEYQPSSDAATFCDSSEFIA
jgi:hypothetical protein